MQELDGGKSLREQVINHPSIKKKKKSPLFFIYKRIEIKNQLKKKSHTTHLFQ